MIGRTVSRVKKVLKDAHHPFPELDPLVGFAHTLVQSEQDMPAETASFLTTDLQTMGEASGYTGSEAALAFVKAQIEHCGDTHSRCGRRIPKPLPTRVVEILGPRRVRLKKVDSGLALYAALSHCWGNNVFLQTTSKNIASHLKKISWNSLPKTFRDAIDFSRRLGLTYIWIDSLCIIQDDRADWQRESAKMRDIYQNAHVTLAATASADGTGGCYRRCPPQKGKLCFARGTNLMYDLTNEETPLLSRGWVLQERLLSPRVVHFMPDEVAWECRQTETCECRRAEHLRTARWTQALQERELLSFNRSIPFKQTIAATSISSDVRASLDAWFHVVECYTRLHLSYPTDSLPAIAGIASRMDNLGFGAYYAGLWERHLAECLCWYTIDKPQEPRLANSSPSWSWSSVSGPVRHLRVDPDYRLNEAVISCPLVADVFGEVSGGRIELRVKLIKTYADGNAPAISTTPTSPMASTASGKADDTYHNKPWLSIMWDNDFVDHCYWDDDTWTYSETLGSSLYCFSMGWCRWRDPNLGKKIYMVLSCQDWEAKLFRRVALFALGPNRKKPSPDWKKSVSCGKISITII